MKKALFVLPVLLLVFSCAKELNEVPVNGDTSLAVLGATQFDPVTKTTYSTDEEGRAIASFVIGETDGDEIGIYYVKNGGSNPYIGKNKKMKATTSEMKEGKEWAVFSGSEDLAGMLDVGDEIYAYYPYKASELEVIGSTKASGAVVSRGMVIASEQEMKSGTESNLSLEHVGKYFPLVAKPTTVKGTDDKKVVELGFSNQFTLATLGIRNSTSSEITVTGFDWSIPGTPMTGSFTVDLTDIEAAPQAGDNPVDKVTVSFSDKPTVAVGDKVYGVAVIAPCKQNKISLTVHTTKGDYFREFEPQQQLEYTRTGGGKFTVVIRDEHFVQTGDWKKVTNNSELTTGKYVLVYPQGTEYKLFSFEKTMANAQSAFDLIANDHSFAEVLPKRTELFQTCVNGNYQTVTSAVENAELLDIPAEIADEVAMEATTAEGEDSNGSVLLKSSKKNLNITTAIISLNDDKSAKIKAQVNAVDVDNILTELRGHQISVTFATIVDFAGKKVGMSQGSISNALTAFDNLCVVAKDLLEEHDFGTLMDINRNTRVLDVFARYYDNVAPMSLAYNSDVAFGWINPVGFYAANDGFSAHIPMPSSIWFRRVGESLNYGEGGMAGFVAYWQKFDRDYPQYAKFLNRTTLFGRLAEKLAEGDYVSDALFSDLAKIDWVSLGQSYERYVNSLNGDPLEKVYLYKYIGE